MRKRYHIQITTQALEQHFSPRALKTIIKANTGQDSLAGQLWHPEYHFDASQFERGYAYMEEQLRLLGEALQGPAPRSAWVAFGRLVHAVQDFYAHSTYIRLWAVKHASGSQLPPPEAVDPLDEDLLNSPELISGRIYYPWEVLSFVGLAAIMRRILPEDSHTALNLDGPEQGPLFEYARVAAIQRTRHEFNQLCAFLSLQEIETFTDLHAQP
jgi:hypothetical protein